MDAYLLLSVLGGIALLLLLILWMKLPAFIALLISSIVTALSAGMDPLLIMDTVKSGMGSTLGFVATVVGLGAIFGGILEHTGSARVLASFLLSKTGERGAPLALMLTGFLVSIPIFFDVGIILLFPLIAGLHRQTGKSLIRYAVPLFSGLAVSHAFIPPTPGPLAVAEILHVPLGWVLLAGVVAGLPAAFTSGILYGRYLEKRLDIQLTPDDVERTEVLHHTPSVALVLPILLLPILLIVLNTGISSGELASGIARADQLLQVFTHPFSALILSNILAWYLLGKRGGLSTAQLSNISTKSLYPAGIIILVTGAGGVFKQVLIDTGAGKMMAEGMQAAGMSLVFFAFLTAAIIRILQGSATVAMITAAGLVAALLPEAHLSNLQLGALSVSIASGATVVSHLNDSGFWMIKEFMRIGEKEAMQTWTVASTILGVTGFAVALLLFQ